MSTNTEVSPGEEITDKASRTNRTIQEVKAEGRKRRLRYQREMEKDLDHMVCSCNTNDIVLPRCIQCLC